MKKFKEYNERLNPDGSDTGLSGVNDEGLGAFKDIVYKITKIARFDKKEFQYHMDASFYSSEDWPKDAKQVGKLLVDNTQAAIKVSKMVDKWGIGGFVGKRGRRY